MYNFTAYNSEALCPKVVLHLGTFTVLALYPARLRPGMYVCHSLAFGFCPISCLLIKRRKSPALRPVASFACWIEISTAARRCTEYLNTGYPRNLVPYPYPYLRAPGYLASVGPTQYLFSYRYYSVLDTNLHTMQRVFFG